MSLQRSRNTSSTSSGFHRVHAKRGISCERATRLVRVEELDTAFLVRVTLPRHRRGRLVTRHRHRPVHRLLTPVAVLPRRIETLRVVEDAARLALDDERQLKQEYRLRIHAVAAYEATRATRRALAHNVPLEAMDNGLETIDEIGAEYRYLSYTKEEQRGYSVKAVHERWCYS